MLAGTSINLQGVAPPVARDHSVSHHSIQAEFLSREEQPAARATRITRKRNTAAASNYAGSGGMTHVHEAAATAGSPEDNSADPNTDAGGAERCKQPAISGASEISARHSESLMAFWENFGSDAAARCNPNAGLSAQSLYASSSLSAVLCHSQRRRCRWKRRRQLPAAGRGRRSAGAAARGGHRAPAAGRPCSGRRLPSRHAPQQVKGVLLRHVCSWNSRNAASAGNSVQALQSAWQVVCPSMTSQVRSPRTCIWEC